LNIDIQRRIERTQDLWHQFWSGSHETWYPPVLEEIDWRSGKKLDKNVESWRKSEMSKDRSAKRDDCTVEKSMCYMATMSAAVHPRQCLTSSMSDFLPSD
jgi:hypothetical protein